MAVLPLDSLPLGCRFSPTDAELVDHYLRSKINGDEENSRIIREIDVCKHEPWDLPDLSAIPTKYPEWFFFCPRDVKHPSGSRLNRATHAGYWKATGKDRKITLNAKLIGMKKTLVFYTGRAPKGQRTHWVMHEYRTTLEELDGTHPGQSAFVLCRLFNKQDEAIKDSNLDVAELDDSPTAVKFSPADTESELEMPQDSPFPALLAGPSMDHDTKREVIDLTANEVNLQSGDDSIFDYPLMYPLSWPLSLQIKEETGSSAHEQFKCSGLSVTQGPNDNNDDVTDFLDSILTDGNDANYVEGSLPMFGTAYNQAGEYGYSEANLDENVPPELTGRNFSSIVGDISEEAPSCKPDSDRQHRIHVPGSSSHPAAADSESPFETGIRTRPRPKLEVPSPKVAAQGDAARRLRVQRKLQLGPTVCQVYPRDPEQSNEDHKSKNLDTEETKEMEQATGDVNEEASTEDVRSSVINEEPHDVSPSEEDRAKDDAHPSIQREARPSSAYTFLTLGKALLPLCSSINLFRFFTLLVLSLSLIGVLFWSSSSQY